MVVSLTGISRLNFHEIYAQGTIFSPFDANNTIKITFQVYFAS